MTSTRRLLAATLSGVLLTVGLLTAATISAQADPEHGQDHTHFDSVGDRRVGEKIPMVGYLVNAGNAHDKNLVLQRKKDGVWHNVARLTHRADGKFRFPARVIKVPQVTVWRVMVKRHGHVLHKSNNIVVHVLPPIVPPAPVPVA